MKKRWRIRPHDSQLILRMERAAGVPSVVAQLLAARGITDPGAVQGFLDTRLSSLRDPEQLPGMTAAADRIHEAVRAGRRIVIYGDYDADGMTATALLFRCLRLLGADVGYFLPCRMDEGYGLHEDALRRLALAGAQMVVSVDCGIGSVDEARTARQIGLELIITDHHQLGNELPDATVVHPQLPGYAYPFGSLCGVGVAFKLAWALCQRTSRSKRVSEPLRDFLLEALGLAAIGTVADVVPLIDENRVIVKHGLTSLRSRPAVGVAELMRIGGLVDKRALTSEDIAFGLAPRLNAAGRLGQAQLGVELLATDQPDRARSLAEYIDQLNENRLHLERSIYLSANRQIQQRFDPSRDVALVLADRDWHQGVIGIVAGRLAEKYHRPVVMISLDELGSRAATGSARGVPGLDLCAALAGCREHLLRHGGHAAAAGLKIEEFQVDRFRAMFCQAVQQQLEATEPTAELMIDAEASLPELTLKAVEEMERMAPFGQGNPRPLLCASAVRLLEAPRAIGKGERHLSVRFGQHGHQFRGLAFNRAEWIEELSACEGELDIAFRPVINEFRGTRKVELHLADWRICQGHRAAP
jgi:single-stranded-DNA-specific exonuclease